MLLRRIACLALLVLASGAGCASIKQSDTSRTGVEQLLISSAVDRALDKVDLRPIARAKVYVETKYLDCTDKNYVILAMHQRLLKHECTLVEKAEEADVVCELGSGGVGTDRKEVFLGIPEIRAMQFALPRMSLYTKMRAHGTAKLAVVAYDAKTKHPVINSGTSLARSDHNNWSLLGAGPIVSGSVPNELLAATGESESAIAIPGMARRGSTSVK